jgi:uncharacterized protein YdbL (DUF1318 family)
MKLSTKIYKNRQSPYKQIAEKYGVTYNYVAMVANGFRKPTKKKGLDVLKALKEMANNQMNIIHV